MYEKKSINRVIFFITDSDNFGLMHQFGHHPFFYNKINFLLVQLVNFSYNTVSK